MKSENLCDGDAGRALSGMSKKKDPQRDKEAVLTLEFERSDGAVVLHCRGRILFRKEFQTLPSVVAEVLPSARRLIVDLAGVESIDSGGLGELVLTQMWAEASGYELKFARPKKSVQQLFEITHLESVFDVYASVPEAIAAMPHAEARSA
jgi:anti-sigma B factor antagonist